MGGLTRQLVKQRRSAQHQMVPRLILAAVAAVSVWLSLGAMAITDDDTRMRVVVLPPLWILASAAVAAAAALWVWRPRLTRLSPIAITSLLWLPNLPGAIPAAFLIWYGPISIGVWTLVVAALFREHEFFTRAWAWIGTPSLAPWIAGTIAAIAFGLGAAALRTQLPVGDEPHYLMMTQSLIKDGDLRIENNHKNRDYAAFSKIDIAPHYLRRGADGEIYSTHAPGVSVLVLPGFAAAGYYGAVGTVILCVAVGSAIAWDAAWILTASSSAAWIAWASIFLTAPVFLHAITVFPDAVATLPVAVALWLLVAMERERPYSMTALMSASVLLASLPWLHSRFALIAAGLGLAILLRLLSRAPRTAILFMAMPVVSATLWLTFFWAIWGTPSPAAPWGSGLTAQLNWIPRGVEGLLMDQQAGLLPAAPVYLCALSGLVALSRRCSRLALETGLIAGALMLSVASYEPWWGGHGGPARYIVAILPLSLPAIAVGAGQAGSWRRHASVLLLGISGLLLASKIVLDRGAHAFFPEGGFNPLVQWLATGVDLTSALPSLVGIRDAHFVPLESSPAIWTIGIWFVTAMVAVTVCRITAVRTAHRFAVTAFACAGVIMVAATGVWAMNGHSGLTPVRSSLAFIDAWQPRPHDVSIQWRRPYFTSPDELSRRIELNVTGGDGLTLPAGQYEVLVEQGSPTARGMLVATVGDSALALGRWAVEAASLSAPIALRVPVRTAGLRFRGEGFQLLGVKLRLAAPRLTPRTPDVAARAAAFGDVRVFFLDDHTYAEPGGFWIPAATDTQFILDRPSDIAASVGLRLRGGPVATTIDLTLDGQRQSFSLMPEERREFVLPPSATGAARVSVRPTSGFQPATEDPQNRDRRSLSAWVEVF